MAGILAQKKQKNIPLKEYNDMKEFFRKELERREAKIKELEEKNLVLLKSALKQAQKGAEWHQIASKLSKKK